MWFLLGHCAEPMSNGWSNLFGGIYYLTRARKTSSFRFAERESKGTARGADGSEDYIRSPGKRNIERNLIMSTGRAYTHIHTRTHMHAPACFRCICGHEDFYSSSRKQVRAEKDFSSRCGKHREGRRKLGNVVARRTLRDNFPRVFSFGTISRYAETAVICCEPRSRK